MPERLHPLLARLLEDQGWTGLTDAQDAALAPITAGRHVLLVAPTGHGKTEAALLPVLSRILHERTHLHAQDRPWPTGFKALYITPLRALNRDLMDRLGTWAASLDLNIGVRHGDTPSSQRARQARDPPDLLITTPETLQLLLYGDTLRRHLTTVRFVVVDEVHALTGTERGAQLAVALERLEEAVAQGPQAATRPARQRTCPPAPSAPPHGSFQRIGLSATVADPAAAAAFLAGAARPVQVVQVATRKELRLHVVAPQATQADRVLAARLGLGPEAIAELRAVRRIVQEHRRVLVFHNTRQGAELTVSRSTLMDQEEGRPPLLELHHGSLSPEHRADVEARFKQGHQCALVATSSLELGIDVGAIDHVIQVHSPRSVARLVQRLGRAGHRVGAVSEGTLVAGGPEDALECIAVARRAAEGRLEPLEARDAPLVVLANQLVALANEYQGLRRQWAHAVLTRAHPFTALDEDLFHLAWDALMETGALREAAPGRAGRGGRTRRHFLQHISMIPDERAYTVLDEAAKRPIGRIEDAFVATLPHSGLFVMAGRTWRVLDIDAEAARVRVAPVNALAAVPQWTGSPLPVSREVAEETACLRSRLAESPPQGPATGHAPTEAEAWHAAAAPVLAHRAAGLEVPTDTCITLEAARNRIVANIPLGTRGNEALGRITQALLHQRLGTPVGMESDAYRIVLDLPGRLDPNNIVSLWHSLDPETLEPLVAMVLRDTPLVRHHLVHVAKHFGALPKELDPNRTTRQRIENLMDRLVLQEEALARLTHDRLDLDAVARFLHRLAAGEARVITQSMGPLSLLAGDTVRRLVSPPRSDESLLAEVRRRIEHSDIVLTCCTCGTAKPPTTVADLPRRIACRRCASTQVACLRPWEEEHIRLLSRTPASLDAAARRQRARLEQNGTTVGAFGPPACMALAARGVGPDTATRILQKCSDPEDPAFWREILRAELEFARTSAYWKK